MNIILNQLEKQKIIKENTSNTLVEENKIKIYNTVNSTKVINEVKKELENDFNIKNYFELQNLSVEQFKQLVSDSTLLDNLIKEHLKITAIENITREVFDNISKILYPEHNLTEGIKLEYKKNWIISQRSMISYIVDPSKWWLRKFRKLLENIHQSSSNYLNDKWIRMSSFTLDNVDILSKLLWWEIDTVHTLEWSKWIVENEVVNKNITSIDEIIVYKNKLIENRSLHFNIYIYRLLSNHFTNGIADETMEIIWTQLWLNKISNDEYKKQIWEELKGSLDIHARTTKTIIKLYSKNRILMKKHKYIKLFIYNRMWIDMETMQLISNDDYKNIEYYLNQL